MRLLPGCALKSRAGGTCYLDYGVGDNCYLDCGVGGNFYLDYGVGGNCYLDYGMYDWGPYQNCKTITMEEPWHGSFNSRPIAGCAITVALLNYGQWYIIRGG